MSYVLKKELFEDSKIVIGCFFPGVASSCFRFLGYVQLKRILKIKLSCRPCESFLSLCANVFHGLLLDSSPVS